MKVLLVDDDIAFLALLECQLQNHCLQLITESNSITALSLLRDQHFDLLITDYQMPCMNGADLINTIRSENLFIPVIILSSYDEKKVKEKLTSHYNLKFLNKSTYHDIVNLMKSIKIQNRFTDDNLDPLSK